MDSNLALKRDLGRLLYCSSLLEEKVAKAYEHIAKLTEDKLISCFLGFIARDSFKHAECFRMISEWLSDGVHDCFSDCEEARSEAWKTLVVDAENFLEKSKISSEELASLIINGLMRLESFVAQEYLTVLHAKLVELMADEAKINLGIFKVVLEWIMEDEKRHEKILKMIKDILTKKEQSGIIDEDL